MDTPLTGVVPVVPTIFHDDQSVDLGGTARVVDYLIDAEVDGLCLLANYSEQFSLTDAERDAIARTLLERVAGRLPVIVTTSPRWHAGVVGLILKQSMRLCAIGLGIGLTLAVGLSTALASTLVMMDTFDVAAFSAGIVIVITACLVAAFYPARRAAGVEPWVALRIEWPRRSAGLRPTSSWWRASAGTREAGRRLSSMRQS